MNACEWSVFLNTLCITLAQGKSAEELGFLSLVLSQLATNFAMLASSPPGCQRQQPDARAAQGTQNVQSVQDAAFLDPLLR